MRAVIRKIGVIVAVAAIALAIIFDCYVVACWRMIADLNEKIEMTMVRGLPKTEIVEYGTGFFEPYVSWGARGMHWSIYSNYRCRFVLLDYGSGKICASVYRTLFKSEGAFYTASYSIRIPITWEDGHWKIDGRIDGFY